MLHGTGLAAVGFFFVAVGGVTAQLFASRSAANGAAAAVLVVGLLMRMVGDGVPALAWLRWLSPFGLLALTRPFDVNRGLPVSVLALAAVLLLALAGRLAARRDVGAAILATAGSRPARPRCSVRCRAFAVRRTMRPLAAWSAGIGAYFLLLGLIARSMTEFLAGNPEFATMAAQAGFPALGTVEGYAATLYALLAVPVGVFVAVRLAAVAADENARRLTLLLAAPVTRARLLAAEAAAAGCAALFLVTVAGVAMWAGTATVHAGLSVGDALAGAWNVVPVVAAVSGRCRPGARVGAARRRGDRCAAGRWRVPVAGHCRQHRRALVDPRAVPVRAPGRGAGHRTGLGRSVGDGRHRRGRRARRHSRLPPA